MRKSKRTWVYVHNPSHYDIWCPICKNRDRLQWSEFKYHVWCYRCEIDFDNPNGIFGGPIPWNAALLMMGKNCFDKIELKTGYYMRCKSNRQEIVYTIIDAPEDDFEAQHIQMWAIKKGYAD